MLKATRKVQRNREDSTASYVMCIHCLPPTAYCLLK